MTPSARWARIWRLLKGGLDVAPVLDGITFTGTFEPSGSTMGGWVADVTQAYVEVSEAVKRRPARVVAEVAGVTIGSTSEFRHHGRGWRYEFEVSPTVAAQDVLKERLRVFAIDHLDNRSELRIDGAAQLNYVKQVYAKPPDTESGT